MSGYLKPAVLLLLIFFSHQTFELALEGLELWYTCVVPALLPAVFMITLISSDEFSKTDLPLLFLLSMASGCPGSAMFLSSAYRKNLLDRESYLFWLIALNNPGLPFLISIAFKGELLLILPLYASSLLCALFFKYFAVSGKNKNSDELNKSFLHTSYSDRAGAVSIETAIEKSMYLMLKILGYILMAYIASGLICYIFPNAFSILATCYFELTTGVVKIRTFNYFCLLSTPLLLSVVGFQGLSSIWQVYAVIKEDGVRLPFLIKYKMLNALTAFSIGLLIDVIYKYFGIK